MNLSLKNDKYWILFGILIIALIFFLYPNSTYNLVDVKLTRTDAEKIAHDFLNKRNINVNEYSVEGFVAENEVTNNYLIRTLGNEGFKKLTENENWNSYGWTILFHLNISRDIPHTTYTVSVNNDGTVYGYEREIPDTTTIPSISKMEAEKLMTSTIRQSLPVDLSEYTLSESREENYSNRTDYSFTWKKEASFAKGEMIVTGKIQGNQPGEFGLKFLVPEEERAFFDTGEALYGTLSVIFVAFLMVFSLYYFLKKYHQGEVWINVGKSLFAVYFVVSIISMINMWPNLGLSVNIGSLNFLAVKLIVLMINGFLVHFLLSLLVFATWSVGESYGREFWPEKLKGTDSIIRGHLFTSAAGYSLLRGLIIGLTLACVYLLTSILLNQPGTSYFISPVANFNVFYGFVPVLTVIGGAFIDATLGGIVVTFFVINLSFSKWHKKWISITMVGLITVLARVIAATPPSLNEFFINLLVGFLFGALIGYLYFKFDLLTILTTLFISTVVFNLFTLSAASAGYYELNTILGYAVIIVVAGIYALSRIKKEEFELEEYGLPSHIEKISERERLKKELEIAAKVQLSLLPKEQPHIKGYEISSLSIPAREAGGDYYDFVKYNDGQLGIAIGDVSGKGVGAAIYMTLTKGILQAHAEDNVSPKVVLGKVNRLLYKTIEKNSFVSMFYAILDTKNNSLLYSRAGHNPGIFCSFEERDSKLLMSKGIALGLEEGKVFQETLNEDTIQLKNGDVVVFYTDGFTEAMNHKLEQFGEERLISLIQTNREKHSSEILDLILKDVRKFTIDHPQHDDMTIVILKRQ